MAAEVVPELQEVESSNVHSVGYDFVKGVLYIRYWKDSTTRRSLVSGNIYKYFDVPYRIYRRMLLADSKGKFVWSDIRDQYRYKMIGRVGWRKRAPKKAKKKAPSKPKR